MTVDWGLLVLLVLMALWPLLNTTKKEVRP